ncbi:hypothetical protein ACYULU_10055 [Breznakiellaceae bacterium SP9]
MDDDRIELLNIFDKMNPENRACLLAVFRAVYAAQENGKQALRKQLSLLPDHDAGGERLFIR